MIILCFINRTADSVTIRSASKDIIKYTNEDGDVKTYTPKSYESRIDELIPGKYIFKQNELKYDIFIDGKSYDDIVSYCIELSGVDRTLLKLPALDDKKPLVPQVSAAKPKVDLTLVEDVKRYKTWFRLIRAVILYTNASIVKDNNYALVDYDNDIIKHTFAVTGVTSAVVYDINNKYIKRVLPKQDDTIIVDDIGAGVYCADFYLDNEPMTRQYFYHGSTYDVKNLLYDDRMALNKTQKNIVLAADSIVTELSLPYETSVVYATMKWYNQNNTRFAGPRITLDNGYIKGEYIDIDKVKEFAAPLYLTFAEFDTLSYPGIVSRKIRVTGNGGIDGDYSSLCFNNEDYYVYLATESGTRLSSFGYTGESIFESIRDQENIRLIRRIDRQLMSDVDTETRRDAILALDEAAVYSDPSRLHINGIYTYALHHRNKDILKVIESICRDYVFHKDVSFGSNEAVIRPFWGNIEIPVEGDYFVEAYGVGYRELRRKYYVGSNTSTTVRYDNDPYTIIFVWDRSTGKSIRGHIIFDNTQDRISYRNYEFPVRVELR